MPNAWVTNVKKFAANSNVSYSCAISMPECKQSYKKEPKPETKPYTKYDKPIGPVKPINIENIKKNEEIINDIEKTLTSKSTRNKRAFQNKYGNSELLKNLFESQAYKDFFPTSQKCLEHFNDYLRYIEKEENILEPSVGIGSYCVCVCVYKGIKEPCCEFITSTHIHLYKLCLSHLRDSLTSLSLSLPPSL
jgi:hypothetical protein